MRVFKRSSRSMVHKGGDIDIVMRIGHAVARQAAKDVEQRQIRRRGRFVEPMLLEVKAMLGMPDEGQMRVQHQR